MKKMKFYAVLVAVLALLLVGCSNSELATLKREATDVAALKTDKNVLVFSTLSSATALEVEAVSYLSGNTYFGREKLEIDMDKANEYLLMMENILADGGPIVSSETESDREGYEMMMTVTVKDLAGNTNAYTIYYSIIIDESDLPTEEVLPEEPSTEETNPEVKEPALRGHWGYHRDDDGREDDKDDHKYHEYHNKAHDQFKDHHREYKEDEVEYAIDALAVIDGVEYEVFGKKEVETEEDGQEVEIKFIVKLDEGNYVSIEQEIEDNEIEYKYDIYKNGRRESSLKFETEEENGKTHIKLSTTNNLGQTETYKFIKDIDKTIIKYESRGYSYTLIVTSSVDEEGNIVYDYVVKERDFKWQFHKNHKHH